LLNPQKAREFSFSALEFLHERFPTVMDSLEGVKPSDSAADSEVNFRASELSGIENQPESMNRLWSCFNNSFHPDSPG
jgi:hypothetical protein